MEGDAGSWEDAPTRLRGQNCGGVDGRPCQQREEEAQGIRCAEAALLHLDMAQR